MSRDTPMIFTDNVFTESIWTLTLFSHCAPNAFDTFVRIEKLLCYRILKGSIYLYIYFFPLRCWGEFRAGHYRHAYALMQSVFYKAERMIHVCSQDDVGQRQNIQSLTDKQFTGRCTCSVFGLALPTALSWAVHTVTSRQAPWIGEGWKKLKIQH